jgi:hypothetical protein
MKAEMAEEVGYAVVGKGYRTGEVRLLTAIQFKSKPHGNKKLALVAP